MIAAYHSGGLGSLGAYPDQVWYDPNRPSLLPYYIDTPTESSRKYSTLWVGNPSGQTDTAIDTDTLWELNNPTGGEIPTNYGNYIYLAGLALAGIWLIRRAFR